MAPHLSEKEKKELREILRNKLTQKVELVMVLDKKNNEELSELAEHLAKEVMEACERVEFEFVDADSETGKKYLSKYESVLTTKTKGPVIFFKNKPNIVYFGFPIGMEFPVFMDDLEAVSKNQVSLNVNVAKKISKINSQLDVLVFVTSSCPYCPLMTHPLHKFAFINDKINGVLVQSEFFNDLAEKHGVYAVPKTVILRDGEVLDEFEGAIPEIKFAERLERFV